MAVPQVSFQSLINSMAFKAGLNADASLNTASVNVGLNLPAPGPFNFASWTDFLNDAILWAWKPDPERPEVVWPYTVQSGTLNSVHGFTGGLIAWNAVGYADWWRIWSTDPRPYANPPVAYPIPDTWDGCGIYPRTSALSVFAFWRPMRPVFTYTAVTDTSYNAGSYVYDPTSGNVYLASASEAPGGNLSDPSWTVQTVPDPLVKPILSRAEAFRVKSKGNDPSKELAEADALLQAEKERALPVMGPPPPWSFDLAA